MLRLLPFVLLCVASPVVAQGKGHGHDDDHAPGHGRAYGHEKKVHYEVRDERVLVTTRDVLVHRGYVVERVEDRGDVRVIYYRRGNMGRGHGRGPVERLVIRRVDDRLVWDDAPSGVVADINVRLRL
jgi:hypothetical protein